MDRLMDEHKHMTVASTALVTRVKKWQMYVL